MSDDIKERADYLMRTVKDVLIESDFWGRSQEQGVPLHSEFDNRVRFMCEAFRHGDLPEACRRFAPAVAELDTLRKAYHDDVESSGGHYTFPPPERFFALINDLSPMLVSATQSPPEYIESPKQLVDLGNMTAERMANIFGWRNERGGLDVARAQRVMADTTSREYLDPVKNPKWLKDQAERQIEEQRREESRQRHASKLASGSSRPCPETLEDLVLQKVGPVQICRMKGWTLAELEFHLKESGLPMPTEPNVIPASEPPKAPEVASEPADADEGDSAYDPTLSLEEQIVAAHQENPELSHSDLAELYSTEEQPVSVQKVSAILKRLAAAK